MNNKYTEKNKNIVVIFTNKVVVENSMYLRSCIICFEHKVFLTFKFAKLSSIDKMCIRDRAKEMKGDDQYGEIRRDLFHANVHLPMPAPLPGGGGPSPTKSR